MAIDGSHRIAAGITNFSKVRVAQFDYEDVMEVNFEFFKGISHGHVPCHQHILDEGAIEYCRIKDSAALAIIFPSIRNPTYAINEIKQMGEIVYAKRIFATPKFGKILLLQAYHGHRWTTQSGTSQGIGHKVRACFPYPGFVTAVLIDKFQMSQLRETKENIRNFYAKLEITPFTSLTVVQKP